jgi:diacylglycerol kinase (ATP)
MKSCLKILDNQMKCKEKRNKKTETSFCHVWSHGNLPNYAESCWKCKREINYHGEVGLRGWKCIWCWRFLHDKCREFVKEELCDFGELREFIVPPYIVKVSRTRDAPKLHLTEISPKPNWPDWKPLFIVANMKSGSSNADLIVSGFRSILNPLQIIQLGKFFGPKEALQWIVKMSPIKCRILLAGGDGTISWLLQSIQELNIDPVPEVALLPLGTGNDLSRALNWGPETPDVIDPLNILEKIKNAKALQIDRWMMEIKQDYSILTRQFSRHTSRKLYFQNYYSLGVDALVTYNFHQTRESKFWIFSSRLMNKLIYFLFGTQQVMIQDCVDLEKKVEVWLDGEKLELPELQSIV